VLILVASATILGVTYATTTTVKLVSTDNLVKAGRARYLAESGVHHATWALRENPDYLIGSESTLLGPYQIDASSDSYYLGSAPVTGQSDQYILTGRSMFGGVTQTVTMRVHLASQHVALMNTLAPIHYWRLGEPGPLAENTADGAGDWVGMYKFNTACGWPGAIGQDADTAAHFDGYDDCVELSGGAAGGQPSFSGKALTIMAWVNPTTHNHVSGHAARIIAKTEGAVVVEQMHWLVVNTFASGADTRLRFGLKTHVDQVEAEVNFLGTTTTLTSSTGSVPLNKWTLVTVTYDGAQMRIYQDDKLVGAMAKVGFITRHTGRRMWIGGSPTGKLHRPWHGKIDEVAAFDRVLNAAQIKALYDARYPAIRKLAWNE